MWNIYGNIWKWIISYSIYGKFEYLKIFVGMLILMPVTHFTNSLHSFLLWTLIWGNSLRSEWFHSDAEYFHCFCSSSDDATSLVPLQGLCHSSLKNHSWKIDYHQRKIVLSSWEALKRGVDLLIFPAGSSNFYSSYRTFKNCMQRSPTHTFILFSPWFHYLSASGAETENEHGWARASWANWFPPSVSRCRPLFLFSALEHFLLSWSHRKLSRKKFSIHF